MTLTRQDVLLKWFRQWATLKAWARDLSPVKVEIHEECHTSVLGWCKPFAQEIRIYRSVEAPKLDLAGDLDTLVHEMAHAATIDEHHSTKWQTCYSRAIVEITKITIPMVADSYHTLCWAGRDAMNTWWRLSGNDWLVKLAGVK